MKEILVLGEYLANGRWHPAAKFVAKEKMQFNILTAAAMLVTAYEIFESSVEESAKPDFCKTFNEAFKSMMENRHKYGFTATEIVKPTE